MADRHHARVVAADAVHRPRAESEHQPDHSLLGIDAVAPGVEVARERHAG